MRPALCRPAALRLLAIGDTQGLQAPAAAPAPGRALKRNATVTISGFYRASGAGRGNKRFVMSFSQSSSILFVVVVLEGGVMSMKRLIVATAAVTLSLSGAALAAGMSGSAGMSSGSTEPNSSASGMSPSNSAASATKSGASQSEVSAAQTALKQKGLYKGRVDGRMGPETRQAISQFQRQNGLKQTAQLDARTMNELTSGGSTSGSGASAPSNAPSSSSGGPMGSSPSSGGMSPPAGGAGGMH